MGARGKREAFSKRLWKTPLHVCTCSQPFPKRLSRPGVSGVFHNRGSVHRPCPPTQIRSPAAQVQEPDLGLGLVTAIRKKGDIAAVRAEARPIVRLRARRERYRIATVHGRHVEIRIAGILVEIELGDNVSNPSSIRGNPWFRYVLDCECVAHGKGPLRKGVQRAQHSEKCSGIANRYSSYDPGVYYKWSCPGVTRRQPSRSAKPRSAGVSPSTRHWAGSSAYFSINSTPKPGSGFRHQQMAEPGSCGQKWSSMSSPFEASAKSSCARASSNPGRGRKDDSPRPDSARARRDPADGRSPRKPLSRCDRARLAARRRRARWQRNPRLLAAARARADSGTAPPAETCSVNGSRGSPRA